MKPLAASLNPIQDYRIIAPTGREGGLPWRYTLQNPGPDWFKAGYSDSGWLLGQSGFGSQATPGIFINTFWTTPDIWLRRSFSNLGKGLANPYLL